MGRTSVLLQADRDIFAFVEVSPGDRDGAVNFGVSLITVRQQVRFAFLLPAFETFRSGFARSTP